MRNDINIKLYLFRHGKTERNSNPDLIGQLATEPLNAEGERQAALLGERLKRENVKFDHIYYSPYARAEKTMLIACNDMLQVTPSTKVDALREIHQGDGIDKSRKALYTPEMKEYMGFMGMGFKFPNGECMYEVEHRAKNGWKNILYERLTVWRMFQVKN